MVTFSQHPIRIYNLTWDFCPVTRYKRHFVRYIVNTKFTGISGTFFLGKESEYLKFRKSLIIKDLWTWYLRQPTNAQFWEAEFNFKCRKTSCNLVNMSFNEANLVSSQEIQSRKEGRKANTPLSPNGSLRVSFKELFSILWPKEGITFLSDLFQFF